MVPSRPYSAPGQCEQKYDIRVVRWAPTPMRTQVLKLCVHHRGTLERRGAIEVAK